MRPLMLGACAALIVASAASAGQTTTKDGRFEASVAAAEMSRISIVGEKVTSVRKVTDPEGPQIFVEAEPATGDVFVAFDGDVVGRSFSIFMVTESGKTVQGVLRPAAQDAQTVIVRLSAADAALSQNRSSSLPEEAPSEAQTLASRPAARREGYTDALVALVRLMFNSEAPAGVARTALREPPRTAGPLEMRPIETYAASGLRGSVFVLANRGKEDVALDAGAFMIEGVLASAVSHEVLAPGQAGRLYIVESER